MWVKIKFSPSRLVVLFAGLALVLYTAAHSVAFQTQTRTAESAARGEQQGELLELGRAIEKTISGSQFHSFTIEAKAGQYLHVVVDQRGIDLMVTLFGPDGSKIGDMDRTEEFGPETVLGVSQPPGQYRLEVRPVEENSTAGKYQITLKELRTATEDDKARIATMTAAFDALDEGNDLRDKKDAASLHSALERYNKALNTWRQFGDNHWEASTLRDMGVTFQLLGENQKALEVYSQALTIFRKQGNRSSEALTLDLTAVVHNPIGATPSERRKARDYYNQALLIFREIGDRGREVNTLNNIGLIYGFLGQHSTSLKFFDQALPISRTITDRNGEGKTLYNTGRAYNFLGEMQKALELYNQALPVFRAVNNPVGESGTLHDIGSVYHALGEMQKALELYNQSLELARTNGDQIGEGANLNDIGGVYSDRGEKQKALEYYNQALPIRRAVGDRSGEATTLNNIGGVYDSWGETQKALEFYNQALIACRFVGDRSNEATTLNNIGHSYRDLGETQKGIEFYEQSLLLFQALEDRGGQATTLNNMGSAYDDLGERRKAVDLYLQARPLHRAVGDRGGEAYTLNNMGAVLADIGEKQDALEFFNQALSIFGDIDDSNGQALALNNIGGIYDELGERQKSLKSYNQALVLYRLGGNRSGETSTLGNLLFDWKELGKPALAILYGKHAINLLQALRGNIQGLDKALQKTYLAKVEPTYRFLADLLISEGRLTEAQQTLNLFKDQQFFDFDRDPRKQTSLLTLTPHEALMLQRYEQTTNRFGSVARKVTEMKRTIGKRQPTPQETAQVQQSEVELKTAADEFRVFLKDVENDFALPSSGKDKVAETADTRELQTALRELDQQTGQKAVAVYTLVGADNFRALLITANNISAASQPIKGDALNEKALQLWGLLQSDKYDPTSLGQELYSVVFKPLESQLPKDTSTILWSLDGNLRYVPMAALHDGKRYLVERYNHVAFTRADRERLLRAVSPHWTGLGMGSSAAHTVEVLGDKISFNALPGVTEELRALFRQKDWPGGVIDGEVLPDGKFTKAAMLAALKQKRPLVHISSHFSFRPGDEARSFLLLGDGTAMTLEEMKQQLDLFAGVELLTLSACNTAAQQAGANGREIDGFAELAQRLGAGSVMATLWPVADNSTPWLMREFYQSRQRGEGLSKAEAFRRAQLALLNGTAQTKPLPAAQKGSSSSVKIVVGANNGKRDSGATRSGIVYIAEKDAPAFKRDDKKPFAHPYYWAPFILIGNWK